MKYFLKFIILVVIVGFASCKARKSYNSVEGKKKLKYYNSIQYDRQHKPMR